MAPVLLLLATHVALALNSNRYNATESSIKREHVNHLQRENFPPGNATYLNEQVINGAPRSYYSTQSQTWSTPMAFGGGNGVSYFKPVSLGGGETEFTTSQTFNKSIDPKLTGDESARTAVNSINFTKANYNIKNNETKEEIPRPLENTTNSYYYQDLHNEYNRTYANLNKHLKPSIKSRKQESIKPKDRSDKSLNNYETLVSRGINEDGLKNNQTLNRNNFECSTDTNLIKLEVNSTGSFVKPSEHRRAASSNSPISVLSKLMNTLKPNSVRFDKTPTDTTRNPRIWSGLQATNTPNALPSYAINSAQIERTKDAYRQQNRSISPELIGTGLRFKSAVIKRAHSPTTNQSTPSAGDLANDAAALFNTGLGHPLGTTNSFVITHHQGILNDSPSTETKSSHRITDNQASTVAPSPANLYTASTREVSESYANRFTKFPAGENIDAVSLSPTSTSRPDTVHQKFQEGLKTTKKKSILQATREPVTESQILTGDTFNKSRVNLNFRNALSTPVYSSVKRNLVQVDTGLTVEPLKIYEPISPCTNCPNATDRVSSTTISTNSDNKLGDDITDPHPTTRQILNDKNAISNANLSRATFGHDATPTDNFFTHLNVSQGYAAVSSRQDKTEKSMVDVTPVSFNSTADEVSDIYEGLLMTTSASDEIAVALNVTADLNDNDTFAVNISSSSVKVISEFPWPVKKEAVVEGDLVLGGLMMVHEREDTVTCGPVMPQGGIQALEAMLYTLDRLNEAPTSLLPNITLGAHILDDCDKDTYGLEMAVDFIKGSISNIDGAEYHCNKTQVRKVISGVVGAASSVTSIQVANLLRLFKIPQVSFFSTSPELSNKQRFEYFTRTIPSDHYQVKAMVDIVRLMGWSYISIIYEESNYGIKAFEELEDLLADYNICIAVKEKLVKDSGVADESAYDNIVQKLLTKPRARGTIIFGSDQEVAGVMRAVKRSNATGSFSWIGSDGWSARSLVSDGNEAEVEGTLSVQPQANPVKGFEEYFLNLNVENNRRNPWFVEFWEDHFQCRYPNSSRTPYNQKYTHLCTGKENLSRQNTVFENQLQFVSDAVMAFAYAIRDMHKDLCHGRPGLCDAMKPTKGTELLKYLRKVDFEGLSGDRFHFDVNGDGPARYNIIHFKQVSAGKYRWIRVGEYVEGELRLNMSEIQFKLGHPKSPESVCSFPCDLGQAKKYVEGESCCWHCFNCTQYQIRHPTDPTQCVGCPLGTVPDPLHVRCIDIPEEYLRPESGWAIGAMALSSTGILITTFVVCVFIRYNDTPVVRASGRELSYVLLAGILMCYCVTFALVVRPTDIVCGIQRFGAGFCFTVVYAALLTKTNRISRIFNAGKHSAKRPSFISPRSQLIICSGLVGVQVLINGVWMVISPAKAMHHYPTREDNLLVCSTDIDASYMIAFTYPILLIVVCTVYAVLTRKIPEAFNESKHIGFTMYTTCVIWLAFVPLYFGTANHVALRITSMSVTISLSASVTVACLFSPKLYIILIRPERNVRQSMMPMRYSAINKSSGTAGSGSMMAPVMVTAATCDQKQQIQKHVPPLTREMSEKEDTDISDGKAKPLMIDCSTLTDPPPPAYCESVLNNTDEYIPKMNNNCSVGNGPLALLPGIQIKDLPL